MWIYLSSLAQVFAIRMRTPGVFDLLKCWQVYDSEGVILSFGAAQQ
jgi:hypothetical protein